MRREHVWGISCEKSRFYAKKSHFFQFEGGARRVRTLDPPLGIPFLTGLIGSEIAYDKVLLITILSIFVIS